MGEVVSIIPYLAGQGKTVVEPDELSDMLSTLLDEVFAGKMGKFLFAAEEVIRVGKSRAEKYQLLCQWAEDLLDHYADTIGGQFE